MAETAQAPPSDAQLFRDIFDASPLGIAVENFEGQPLFVNRALCSMLGFSQEEMCTKHCVQFSPPEDAEKDWALFQQLRAGSIDRYQLDKRYFRRDGSLVWGRLSISLLRGRPSPLVVAMVEDITEKKKAEEARFRHTAIVDSSEDAIASATLDGVITSWNAGAQRIFGYTENEVVGRSATILVPPWLPDEENKILETLRAGGRIEQLETVRITKTGKRINVSLSISPIRGATGEVVGCSGIARDITERKRAEEVLRTSEERFRLAAHAGKMFAYEWDVATDVVVRSGDVDDVLGPTSDEPLTRQQILATVHPDDRARFVASITERTPEDPNVQITYRMLGADGSVVWLEKTAHAFFDEDDRMVRMIGMVSAITGRKRAEDTLRESEEKFRTVFRDAGVGMVIVSPEGRFLAANGTFCECLGYTEEELLGKSVESITLADDWPAFSKRLSEVLAGGDRLQRFEKRCVHKSGRSVYTESTASLIRSRDGKPRYFVGEVLDVTNRREAEATLSNINRRLIEAQEQERTRIGRELHDDVTQRLALLAIELEQLQQNPSEVESRVVKLRKETSEILSDVEALSHELHSSKLQYLGAVAGIRSWCREFGERQNMEIDFRSDVATALPLEIGVCLFRVLQEALHNAVKHSGVKRVEVCLMEQSNQVHLTVSDSGKGFNFEPAMRGKGLGLTSMQERVRLVNGTIAIESKPMGGTTIEVRVPLESQRLSQRAS